MIKRLLVITVAVLSVSFSSKAQINVFNGSLSELLKEADNSGKDALVMVSASWCAPCKLFMKNLAPMPEMGEFVNSRFIFGHYDIDKEDPYQINKTYGVSAYPTFLILDSNGNEIGRAVGASSDFEEMKELFESAYTTPVLKLREEFENDPVSKAEEYINALREEYRVTEIQNALDKLCGVMDPAVVIATYIRDIKFNTTDDFTRPLALAISNTDTLYKKYGTMLERPITTLANNVMDNIGKSNADDLSLLKSAIAEYEKYTSKFALFVSENGDAIINGDIPYLLQQIENKDKFGPQPRLTALYAIMRKTKANKTLDQYKDQMRSVLESLDAEPNSDKNFMKNLWKYVE